MNTKQYIKHLERERDNAVSRAEADEAVLQYIADLPVSESWPQPVRDRLAELKRFRRKEGK